jgi:hypothetical protein
MVCTVEKGRIIWPVGNEYSCPVCRKAKTNKKLTTALAFHVELALSRAGFTFCRLPDELAG